MENEKMFDFSAKVDGKGRIQCPKSIRELWALETGDWVHIVGTIAQRRDRV